MQYEGDVYRPPSEARSFILQCTVGCANNTCLFCYMYKDDRFHMRKQEDILADIEEAKQNLPYFRRVFLADGDALVMPTNRLLEIIHKSFQAFPQLERVSSYGTVRDILNKSDEELKSLAQAGLDLIYIGLESGSDQVLQTMHKDQTQDQYVQACKKLKKAGLRSSITLLLGLGQKSLSKDHIEESARAISRSNPDFVSFLSLQLSPGTPLYQMVQDGDFKLLSDEEEMMEMRRFVELTDSPGTVFRSNHASNPVAIAGTFNQDRDLMLAQIDRAVKYSAYRPEGWRGL